MQTVKYQPIHGSKEPVTIAGIDLIPGEPTQVDDAAAEQLLRSCFIVDAKTGKNANFVCTVCGVDVLEDAVFDPIAARIRNSPIKPLVGADGKRKCAACIDKPAPAYATAFTTKIAAVEPA